MLALYVPPVLFKYSKLEASEGYWYACEAAGLVPTVQFVSVLVAHGAFETGNFQVGCWNNNPGNIKAGEKFRGKYTCITLNEQLRDPHSGAYNEMWFSPQGELTGDPRKGGKLKSAPLPVPPGHAQTRMCAFDTLADGLLYKVQFFLRPEWVPVLGPARRGDAGTFVRMIRARRYFTAYPTIPLDKETPYERSVISLARTYRPFVEQVAAAAGSKTKRPPPPPKDPVPAHEAPLIAMRVDLESAEEIA